MRTARRARWKTARHWQILANDQAKKAADYLPLIVAYRNGAAVRIADLGDVVDSVQDLRNDGSSNGKKAVLLVLNRQPNANIIDTVDRVKAELPQLAASIPSAIDVAVVLDRTPTIRASLRDVERTLMISIALVIMVVFLFLRNWRATLIPSVAVPVSLVGTFGIMYLCGYSLDNLSLMALTIATGFVVDDAIVVLENISRRIEEGMDPMKAALQGSREVGFTVLSMSMSLIAVFIPILLMGGIVGRLFREFAVVLSVAILISLVVSLTATPMMCARLLRNEGARAHGRLYRASERVFTTLLAGYEATLAWALRHGLIMMVLLAATVCLNVYLYIVIPKGFFPQQDTGRLVGNIQADQSISFQAMQQKLADFVNIVRQDPDVQNVVAFTGGGQRNRGSMFASLKPLGQRKLNADQVIARLRGKLSKEPGAALFLVPVQDIRVGGRQANAQYQFTLQADDLDQLRVWEPRVRSALGELPELVDVNTDQEDKGLQTSLIIDRDTAGKLGVTPQMIDATLNDAFGQRQVSTIYNPLNQYRVVMEAAPEFWQSPETLKNVYVSTPGGAQVPLSAFSRYGPTSTPIRVNHQGQYAASTISFNPPDGVSLACDARGEHAGQTACRAACTVPSRARRARSRPRSTASPCFPGAAAVYIVLGTSTRARCTRSPFSTCLRPAWCAGAGAARLPHRIQHHRADRRDPADRHRQKNAIMMIDFALDAERKPGPAAPKSDFPWMPAGLPSDHDDHHGRAVRGHPARHRLG
jgi:multidrug efflux pump